MDVYLDIEDYVSVYRYGYKLILKYGRFCKG